MWDCEQTFVLAIRCGSGVAEIRCRFRRTFQHQHPPRQYFSQAIIRDEMHPVLTRKDRMGRRVARAGFAWERGLVANL
ncbi:MAG: hypothetical protein ACKPHU_18615 [Planctomycetaceae bacterium]